MDLPGQISACKRRIEVVRAFIETTTAGQHEAEHQLALEVQLLQMLEAQVARRDMGLDFDCRN